MLYHNEDRRFPSLFVEDGETVTISTRNARETGISVLKMRPRTTAALLVLAGQPPSTAPRLSDRAAFEQIESTEGFVNLAELDHDGRIDGYSIPYIRGVLEVLDPNERVPPKSVKRLFPLSEEHKDCSCTPSRRIKKGATGIALSPGSSAAAVADASPSTRAMYSVREAFVPDFLTNLQIVSWVTAFGDIVVGPNATLVLDSSTNFVIADNFLAYKGSRIVQRASYLNLDVTSTMRGDILKIIHTASTTLNVDWSALAAQAPTKP
ncbi:hypothetical protein [Crenobacter cavernae]|uniref:Uncharacterized protein n=1 Tax=Crenobacter cavernae TaxID=2290923 RepID=A0ABY0F9W8_9NEIS|nr:hypothetical protein [Crenobacter cavernae]RXZ42057.1 hypothetical protein EBB06_13485 [Crenobacter cavernae]